MHCAPFSPAWLDLPIDQLPFVAIDTETTGFAPPDARLTEVALLPFGSARAKFVSLINPQQPIPWKIQEVTGINDAMVRGAPTIDKVLPQLTAAFTDAIFVAHNVQFDWWFFDHAWIEHLGIPFSMPWMCTLNLSRKFLGLPKNNLGLVAQHMGVSLTQAHRAEADARAVVGILKGFFARWDAQGIKTGRDLVVHGLLQMQAPQRREERPKTPQTLAIP